MPEVKEGVGIKVQEMSEVSFKIKNKEETETERLDKESYCGSAIPKEIETEETEEQELYFTNKKDIKLLSKRQLECLSLCAYGYSNSSISKVLYISESTVKKTMEETFKKLSATSRTNAVTHGFIFGILNTDILNKTAMQYHIKMKSREEWEG